MEQPTSKIVATFLFILSWQTPNLQFYFIFLKRANRLAEILSVISEGNEYQMLELQIIFYLCFHE